LWLEIMNHLNASTPSQPPAIPPELERMTVAFGDELEPPREELFLPGTAVGRMLAKPPESGAASIVYPADGQIIAVDQDIPMDSQRVQFQAEAAPPGSSWRLDGVLVAGTSAAVWLPAPGRHRLGLFDAAGRTLDAVEFEVRGGPVAAPALVPEH
jgi:penicillin-binding protein 1C